MPEGDTIHRTAARLRPALEGKTLVRFEAQRLLGDRPKVGVEITAVEAVGKNLLIRFAGGLVLRTHMKMSGSWHLYRAGERWQKPRYLVRALVDAGDWIAVCFSAPVVETFHEQSAKPSPVDHLGPDLCRDDADLAEAVRRFARFGDPSQSLAEALLDQRIVCGIGNVYKSEALWANRLSPFALIGTLDEDGRHRLLRTASKQLRANLTTVQRTTVPGGLAVYGRDRKPCRACDTPIRRRVHGVQGRSTYWCPSCQPD